MHGVNLSLDWFSSVMALVTDSSRGRNVGCACQDLAWPLYPFERYYFDELHGLAGDTAQLHIGTNLTRHLTDRLHVPCSTKVNGRKNPSIARLNKPTPKQRPAIAVFLCSGWTRLTRAHQLCVAMHLLGTGSCLVGVTTGRTPAQAQALCDMSEYGATFVAARAHSSSSYPAARFMNSRRMQHARRLRTARLGSYRPRCARLH